MFVSSLIYERTLKTAILYKKTGLRETMEIDRVRVKRSQFSYTDIMNTKLLSVVTPLSIYHQNSRKMAKAPKI